MTLLSAYTRIALIGYGNMGKEIERLARQYCCSVEVIFSRHSPLNTDAIINNTFDVAIDFSVASAVVENVRLLAEHGKNIVLGTTG
ncbi:MAG: dihydrodipicolinate reductase, partial [Bacteroidota bacterium]|nr:dihydrodipicolinate reductase [Candidatus Kapabacteria bacterium]MDW8219548.1 dihydrodipicolinate reductase [Bacteroidota bacterium]